jgi:hypothetical protein
MTWMRLSRYELFLRDREAITKKHESWGSRSFTSNVLFALEGYTSHQVQRDGSEARRRSCRFLRSRSVDAETLYFAYPGSPLWEEELKSLEHAENQLLEAQRVSAHSGATLVFVYVPTKFRVYGDFCEFPEDGYGRLWKANDLPSKFDTWCKAHQIPYIDLTAALNLAATVELVYFPDDGHWNAKGHEVVASTISDFLERNGYVNRLK